MNYGVYWYVGGDHWWHWMLLAMYAAAGMYYMLKTRPK